MYYYKDLYLNQKWTKKKDRIIRRLEEGKLQPGLTLITLPDGTKNQLEIIGALILLQPAYPKDALRVVGMAKGKDEAVELAAAIVAEVCEKTGTADVQAYFRTKEKEDGTCFTSYC